MSAKKCFLKYTVSFFEVNTTEIKTKLKVLTLDNCQLSKLLVTDFTEEFKSSY